MTLAAGAALDVARGEGEALVRAVQRAQPVALAQEQVLPVLPAFEALLPESGLRRGTVTRVHGPGATSVALALLAGCTTAGSWAAAIGVSGLGLGAAGELGLAAASELGLALERLLLIGVPAPALWASAVAAALDGADALLVEVPRRVREADARNIQARMRERGAVLVVVGASGALQPDLVMTASPPVWDGLGSGWGHLQARCVPLEVTGRRAAARPRRDWLWLPDPEGEIRLERSSVSAPTANMVALHPLEAG